MRIILIESVSKTGRTFCCSHAAEDRAPDGNAGTNEKDY